MRLLILTFLIFVSSLHAEPRVWKSADGAQSFNGEYVSHDATKVTIRRTDGKTFTLELTRLNEADKNWLAMKDGPPPQKEEPPNPRAVFDNLCFGDSMETVKTKLKASRLVVAGVEETYMGRVGLNGTYRTRQQIGGLNCDLYFDWSPGNTLVEVSLRTQGVKPAEYDSLKRAWNELAELLTNLHGKPLQAAAFPGSSSMKNDLFLASHLWKLKAGGSATLGSSMQEGYCMVVVRFTKERVNPVGSP